MRPILNERNWWSSILEDDPVPSRHDLGEASQVECYPRTMAEGRAARIVDLNGREYSDFCLANGSLILGHPDSGFLESITSLAEDAGQTNVRMDLEAKYSEALRRAMPSMERSLFSESGKDSFNHALRVARQRTGRKDVLLVGPGIATFEDERVHAIAFNDLEALASAPALKDAAAIILEPVPTFPGPIAPEDGYLQAVREIADAHGIILVFDERRTGFRLALGGAQERYHVGSDLTILGRNAAGGLPIGICGGNADLVDGGSDGPIAMITDPMPFAAGLETIPRLRSAGYDGLDGMGERMGKGLEAVLNEFHVRYKATAVGSMFQVFLDGDDRAGASGRRKINDLYLKVQQRLLESGVYFSPVQRGTNFISTQHTEMDIDDAVSAVLVSLGEIAL